MVAQTFQNWELIIVDDGSTDGTREYVAALDDRRIRYSLLTHARNPTRTRAEGLRLARAAWVAFLDSDDLWLPTKLAVQFAQLASRPNCHWGYTAYRVTDIGGAPVAPRPELPLQFTSGWILRDLLTFNVAVALPTLMARRAFLDEVGGFDETIALRGDYDLTLRLAARSEAWATTDVLTLVRAHSSRTTQMRAHSELFRYNERVFRKAARSAPDVALRDLCIRQCAAQLAGMAKSLSSEGRHRAAFAALTHALRDAPLSRPVWRAIVRCALGALYRLAAPRSRLQHR